MVVNGAGNGAPAEACDCAELWVTRTVTLHDGAQVVGRAASSAERGRRQIAAPKAYSRQHAVPVARIAALAEARPPTGARRR
ncbi:hypothetical protein M8494_04770 [Serratia ureilytica]